MVWILFSLIAFISTLGDAKEEKYSFIIDSGEACYDGNELILQENACVECEMGKISASQLILQHSETDKKEQFSHLKMKGDVSISWNEGGTLFCQNADIDYSTLTGRFWGNEEAPDVLYETFVKGEKVKIQGKEMRMLLTKENHTSTAIREIEIKGDLYVNKNDQTQIFAERALYQQFPDKKMLYIYPSPDKFCTVLNENEDRIQCKSITVDLFAKKLVFENSQGCFNKNNQPLKFSASTLVVDDITQQFILQHNVDLVQEGIGYLHTDHQLILVLENSKDKKGIKSIQAPSDTLISYTDGIKGLAHQLMCHGPLSIDHQLGKAHLESPQDSAGNTPQEKQIYLEDLMGDVYCDQLDVDYQVTDNGLILKSFSMLGHVQLFNRYDGHIQESSSILQYALADKVEYFPDQQKVTLSGQNGKRVLFIDKINNLQMSAPSLKARYDLKTKKQIIEGVGDVRFTFIENEFERLKQYFRFKNKE